MWIGISAEENARRCKPSQEAWVTNRYPLRELGLNRADCEAWLLKHHKIVASKSACLGCLIWNMGQAGQRRQMLPQSDLTAWIRHHPILQTDDPLKRRFAALRFAVARRQSSTIVGARR
jgi:hypothetical protein